MLKPLRLSKGHWINVDLLTRIVHDGGVWHLYFTSHLDHVILTPAEGDTLAAFLGLEDDMREK